MSAITSKRRRGAHLNNLATVIAAAAMWTGCSGAALAQSGGPIDRPEEEREPGETTAGGKCRTRAHSPSIYNPHDEVTRENNNHTSLACAMLHAKPGGEVIIFPKRGKEFLPSFKVAKPNLHIRADNDKVIIGQKPDAPCVLIDPPGKNFEDITTVIDGFTFVAAPGANAPCIDVRNGKLKLINSRILMPEGGTVAIRISDTAMLEFTGRNNGVDGVLAPQQAPVNREAIGIEAAFDSEELSLSGIRLQGLKEAVVTRANRNLFRAVSFVQNNVAARIDDDALVPSRAPNLTIEGGQFLGNDDALIFEVGDGSLAAIEPDYQFDQPFDGVIKIGSADGDTVTFLGNLRGVNFAASYPERGFTVENTRFVRNKDYAVGISVPEDRTALLSDVEFNGNAKAIVFNEPLEGLFIVDGGSDFVGTRKGVTLDGGGAFEGVLNRATGKKPIFNITSDWLGSLSLDIRSNASPEIIAYGEGARICGHNLSNRKEREKFARALNGVGASISIGGVRYPSLFAKDGGELSTKELRAAYDALCG